MAEAMHIGPEDARLLLDLAREVAHGSGARQYAPLATYLAGRLAARRGADADLSALVAALTRAAHAAGPAGDDVPGRG